MTGFALYLGCCACRLSDGVLGYGGGVGDVGDDSLFMCASVGCGSGCLCCANVWCITGELRQQV